MELVEQIDVLNTRLIDHFGIDTETGDAMYRIVFSEDEFEKRLTSTTKDGLILLTPMMVDLPKYKQWIHSKYILEKLVVVPPVNLDELTAKKSYEPLFVFQTKNQEYLPPIWDVAKFAIDCVNAATGKESLGPKYVDPYADQPQEKRDAELDKLEEELFGNETDVTRALAFGEGVVVPRNFKKGN